jgi:hypothetical protein
MEISMLTKPLYQKLAADGTPTVGQYENEFARLSWNPDDDRFYVERTAPQAEWRTVGSFKHWHNATRMFRRVSARPMTD